MFFRFADVLHWNGHQCPQWLHPAKPEETQWSGLQDSYRSGTGDVILFPVGACSDMWPSRSTTGGLFQYVSGANYFGEIVEWFGYAVATWSLPTLSFAVFSLSFIGPRAHYHHRCTETSSFAPTENSKQPSLSVNGLLSLLQVLPGKV